MFLPILGLMGIVLYGTTRASKPPALDIADGHIEMSRSGFEESDYGEREPRQRPEPRPTPPPAPRLQSNVEAEEEAERQAQAERAKAERAARADSTAQAAPTADTSEDNYVPAPIVPAN